MWCHLYNYEYVPIWKNKYLSGGWPEPLQGALAAPVLGRLALGVRVRGGGGDDVAGQALGAWAVAACGRFGSSGQRGARRRDHLEARRQSRNASPGRRDP